MRHKKPKKYKSYGRGGFFVKQKIKYILIQIQYLSHFPEGFCKMLKMDSSTWFFCGKWEMKGDF